MSNKFDLITDKILQEAPAPMPEAPPAPVKTPAPSTPAPSTPSPDAPNPDPFKRHDPGEMPGVRPKAQSEGLKQDLMRIIRKHTRFLRGE